MKMNHINKDWQLLSAYLDGQLASPQKEKLEARLLKDNVLQEAFSSLEQTKLLLKHARQVKSPRNFTLSQAQAEKLKSTRTFRWLPVLSLSSVLATIMMIFAILMELVISPVAVPLMDTAQSPTGEMLSMQSAPQAESLEANAPEEQPMIIQWGVPGQGGGGSDLMATGLGGGGAVAKGSSDVVGMGGAEIIPNPLSLPPESPSQPQDEIPKLTASGSDGSGLILGLRSAEDTQAYNQVVMDEIANNLATQTERGKVSTPNLRWIQLGLAIIALVTGTIALSMWRKIQR